MSFFTHAAPKFRQEGFVPHHAPPSPPPPQPFDPHAMFFHHPHFPHPPPPDPPRVDFADELAAMLARPPSPPPHNPFDTNSTPAAAPPYRLDAAAPFPAHFSLPAEHYAPYPADRARSRSRSKPRKRPAAAPRPPSPARPHAILIPPPGSPLALHHHLAHHAHTAPAAWFAADAPFSLPTPDSVGASHFGASPRAQQDSPPPPAGADAASKQAALASEKRRRRRESHNAVERRRRDNINEKISELATLIPECMLDPGAAGAAGTEASLDGFAGVPHAGDDADGERKDGAGAVKANKGMILRKSVEYIRYLQQLVNAQASRNRELEAQLAQHPQPHAALGGGGGAEDDMLLLGADDDGALSLGMASPPAESLSPPDAAAAARGRPRAPVRVKHEDDSSEDDDDDGGAKRMEE